MYILMYIFQLFWCSDIFSTHTYCVCAGWLKSVTHPSISARVLYVDHYHTQWSVANDSGVV